MSGGHNFDYKGFDSLWCGSATPVLVCLSALPQGYGYGSLEKGTMDRFMQFLCLVESL
jgi:hypothetical protein